MAAISRPGKLRREVSDTQKTNFPNDALFRLADKSEGDARAGLRPFRAVWSRDSDSTVRFDSAQDWGVIFWLPLVLLGLVEAVRLGRDHFAPVSRRLVLALVVWAVVRRGWWSPSICRWHGTAICFRFKAATPCWPRWL